MKWTVTIGEHTCEWTRPIPQTAAGSFRRIGDSFSEDCEVLNRKRQEVPHADLIDLLLDADEPTRRLLVFQALQTGLLKKSEADDLMAQVKRLERAAAPRPTSPRQTPQPVKARAA